MSGYSSRRRPHRVGTSTPIVHFLAFWGGFTILTAWGLWGAVAAFYLALGVLAFAVAFGGWLRDLPGMKRYSQMTPEERAANLAAVRRNREAARRPKP